MKDLTENEKQQMAALMSSFVPHAEELGIRFASVDGEWLTLRLPYRDDLVGNPDTGTLHGGVLTVLLDHAMGLACITSYEASTGITPTLDLRIDHLGVAPAGKDIYARARVYRVTRRVLFIEGIAYWDTPEKPIARATGSFVRVKDLDLRPYLQSSQESEA